MIMKNDIRTDYFKLFKICELCKNEKYDAEEILAAYHGSQDSLALREKERIEREAAGAR